MIAPEQLSLTTKEQFIRPLGDVFKKSISEGESRESISSKDLVSSLNRLFPEQQFDKNLQKTKQILGETASLMTTEQIKDVMTEVQFLVSSWLDDFERSIFGDLTLKELLHERGGI